jgi:hypothetical protein
MDDCSGRSPDLRVDAPFRLPGENPSGTYGTKLTAYSCGRSCGFGFALKAAPHSHLADLSTGEPEGAHHPNKSSAVNVAQCGLTRLRCVSSVADGSARKG